MNWEAKSIDTIVEQKEYIDTALIPLLLIEGSPEGMKQSASAAEFLMNLTPYIEKQFKGRIVEFPPFSYTPESDRTRLATEWKSELEKMEFKHYIFLTTDRTWMEEDILPEAVYVPSIPLEHMDKQVKQSVLQDQLRQLIPLLSKRWNEL